MTDDRDESRLEERVVGELRARGYLRPRRTGRLRWPARAALAAGVFAAGLAVGIAGRQPVPPSAPAPTDGPLFLLLLYGGDAPEAEAEGEAARVAEYREWSRGLRRVGALVSAERLDPPGAVLGGGPQAEAALGYFLVRARTLDEALALARGCPHLRHGGRLAVQAVSPT
jgi:hypothetical protein